MITKNEFAVLAALEREPGTSQRAIAARKAMSLGSVNAAYKALVDKGLVVDGALSDAGFEALAPFKVDNAIILAAGLSSRFAPISYEKPKGRASDPPASGVRHRRHHCGGRVQEGVLLLP